MEEKIFKCPNDLKVTVKKDGGEVVLDEECCTGMVILLKNDGNMATSFYGYHNEKLNRSFATMRARAREFSKNDTLYLHGDTIRTYLDDDSLRVMIASPKVRF